SGIAGVETDGGAFIGSLGRTHGMRDEGLQQRRGNVVDAVEAEVLQHVEGHALSGTGQTADDEDAHALDVSDPALHAQGGTSLAANLRHRPKALSYTPRFSRPPIEGFRVFGSDQDA